MMKIVEDFVSEHLFIHVVLVALSMGAMIVAMAVDLVTGVQKAKERGECRTSAGYKKTAIKAQKYFSPFAVVVMIDLICCYVIPVPAFSMLWAAYCVFCEFKSVREKSWEKSELRKAENTMSVIVENKDDIAKLAAELLFDTKTTAEANKQDELVEIVRRVVSEMKEHKE